MLLNQVPLKNFHLADGFGTDDIIYKWIREKIKVGVGMTLETFDLIGWEETETVVTLSTGNYSRLGVKFIIDRKTIGFIWRFYTPLTIIWLVSMVPFFLPVISIAFRLLVSCISFLAAVLLITLISVDFIPRSGSITALDVYNGVALSAVFTSLFLSLYQVFIMEQCKSPVNGEALEIDANQCSVVKTATTISLSRKTASNVPESIARVTRQDSIARTIFIVTFIAFQLVYWITVTIAPQILVSARNSL